MDLVRIAETYFRRLLDDVPAERAVFELASAWDRRRILAGSQALSATERLVDRVKGYAFSVGVGGHGLFFTLHPLEHVAKTSQALVTIGRSDAAALLQQAISRCTPYPETRPPSHAALRRARRVSDDPRLAEQDRAVWKIPLYEAILAFARDNQDSILLAERGLL